MYFLLNSLTFSSVIIWLLPPNSKSLNPSANISVNVIALLLKELLIIYVIVAALAVFPAADIVQ